MSDPTHAHVGLQIRAARRLLGILRGGLAAELGTDYATLAAYERGVCEVPPIVMASRCLGSAADRRPQPARGRAFCWSTTRPTSCWCSARFWRGRDCG
jgi:hypothetical protein